MKLKYNVIRQARLRKEYSQEYVAFLLGMSQSHYSKFEKGLTDFTVSQFFSLLDILGLNFLEVVEFSYQQRMMMKSDFIRLEEDESRAIEGGGMFANRYWQFVKF